VARGLKVEKALALMTEDRGVAAAQDVSGRLSIMVAVDNFFV